jgi:activating signal cointegrator 1
MRAISLWQPWASAVAFGSKQIETRHWATAYRGPLAIHAAKRRIKGELMDYEAQGKWKGALRKAENRGGAYRLYDTLPFGAIVAVVLLVDCKPTNRFTVAELDTPRRPGGETTEIYDWTERQMGDFSPGRFGWECENIYRLPEPIPFKGAQGFFNIPDELLPFLARPDAIRRLF